MGILHRRGELDPLVLPQDDNYEKTFDDHQSLKMFIGGTDHAQCSI